MTWGWITGILFCPRDDDRNPIIPRQTDAQSTKDNGLRQLYWQRGFAPHEIEAKIQADMARAKARRQAVKEKQRGRRSR